MENRDKQIEKRTTRGGSATADLNKSKVGADSSSLSRRVFLRRIGGVTAATLAAEVVGLPPLSGTKTARVSAAEIGPLLGEERADRALEIRVAAAEAQEAVPLPRHPDNGDERQFANKIGSYSKALPHNSLGEGDLNAYNTMIHALSTGRPADFEAIILGGTVKLVNPQAAYAFELVGPDSHHLGMIAPPAFSSAWEASEMAEVYWQALTRDIYFEDYGTNPLTVAAASDLSGFSDFRGPKVGGVVTAGTLFRGDTPGDLTGPYISQFLWKDIPFGATTIVQRYRTTLPGDDHMDSYAAWLNIQNGLPPATANAVDPTPRFLSNGRDLAEWVHRDIPYQANLGACLILLGFGGGALDAASPYLNSATQSGNITFGRAHILDLVARAARVAFEAAWYQKWLVHRRLRPEEFGGRVHNHLTGATSYPINSELLSSQAVSQVFSQFGTYLLPQAYAEGCPTHTSYPGGHATIAGAGVTVLKAFFKESFRIPSPVVASADGLSLLAYGGPLTVGGELNKLAANIAIARDFAGIHWRTDAIESLKLGEKVAIGLLRDYRATFNEDFAGFSLTTFNGKTITI